MTDLVPCPTCGLPADLDLRPDDALIHSVCVQGHDHALAPNVLAHLRTKEHDETTGSPHPRP